MENREIARVLAETADLMEIAAEDGFRIRSYRNAASVIEGYPERIEDILSNPERKITEIPGVGKGIAVALEELSKRGSFEKRDALLAQYPPTLLELLKIQGLGPKGIALVYQHYKVATIDELERLCKEQKLRELPRMGAKLEEKVLKSIAQYRQRAGRFLLSFGKKAADELIPYLAEGGGLEKIEAAGSLRRGKDTIGDLDLLVTGPGAADALERFVQHPKAHSVLGKGANKASIQFGLEGLQVDLRALAARKLRRGHAIFHRQQGAQHRAAQPGAEAGPHAQRIRAVPRGERAARGRRDRGRSVRKARSGLDSAGAARELRRDRGGAGRPLAQADRASRHSRRSAHAHHRDRRPGDAGRNGRSGARVGLRVHRHHGSFQSAGDGEWPGRERARWHLPSTCAS